MDTDRSIYIIAEVENIQLEILKVLLYHKDLAEVTYRFLHALRKHAYTIYMQYTYFLEITMTRETIMKGVLQ